MSTRTTKDAIVQAEIPEVVADPHKPSQKFERGRFLGKVKKIQKLTSSKLTQNIHFFM
jgi:hypothetical protein